MDWLRQKLTGQTAEQVAAKKAKKRGAKNYQKKVRAREAELRRAAQGGGHKSARFFWGHPFESYDHARHGKRDAQRFKSFPQK
ncbi:hypothetical protein N7468_001711 [Penicillium chermesinum]|uniref:Uncharacterized protein n=1 Tax=Penicillium chermesinum TaxID=63820 RepID=A0A9W9TXM8_9EURO|nr:uncharacterized protein N7468_001711 [Penicillium chermesinum]KAJ5246728.1 hypothetical protein N7468_001711 [Penicillium chermesinum]